VYGTPLRGIIVIEGTHNHHLECADTLRKNRVSDDLVSHFNAMFDDGCTPAQAKKLHTDQLLSRDAFVDLADNKINPTTNSLYYLHRKWSRENHGSDISNPLEKIQEKISNGYYKDRGTHIKTFSFLMYIF
jgi:hypothetical protein